MPIEINNMSIKSISTEASNKIWNQSGKHTHSELDEIIKSVLSSQLAEVIKMAEEMDEEARLNGDGRPSFTDLITKLKDNK